MCHFYRKWKQQMDVERQAGNLTLSFKDWFINKVSRRFTYYGEQWVWKKRRQQMQLFDQQWVIENLQPSVFIDVGSAVGHYPVQLRKKGYNGKIIAIEPTTEFFVELKKAKAKYGANDKWININCAISDVTGNTNMYVCATEYGGGGGTSSLLKPTDYLTYNSGAKCTEMQSVTLMTLHEIINIHAPDADDIYIKVDVQGLEKKVMQGGAESMHKVLGCKLEMAVNNADYQDQPHMWDIIQYMRSLGFVLVHLEHTWRDGVGGSHELIYVDGVFLNKHKMEILKQDT